MSMGGKDHIPRRKYSLFHCNRISSFSTMEWYFCSSFSKCESNVSVDKCLATKICIVYSSLTLYSFSLTDENCEASVNNFISIFFFLHYSCCHDVEKLVFILRKLLVRITEWPPSPTFSTFCIAKQRVFAIGVIWSQIKWWLSQSIGR